MLRECEGEKVIFFLYVPSTANVALAVHISNNSQVGMVTMLHFLFKDDTQCVARISEAERLLTGRTHKQRPIPPPKPCIILIDPGILVPSGNVNFVANGW